MIAKKPDTVFIEFGINDAYLPYKTSVADARANLETMITRILEAKPDTEIILMTMNPPTGVHLERRPGFKDYYQMYRDVAKERKILLIDHEPNWERILEEDKDMFFKHAPEGLHPVASGATDVIAPTILQALGI